MAAERKKLLTAAAWGHSRGKGSRPPRAARGAPTKPRATPTPHLVIGHGEDVAEAPAADVVCHLRGHQEGVLEGCSTHGGHIGAGGQAGFGGKHTAPRAAAPPGAAQPPPPGLPPSTPSHHVAVPSPHRGHEQHLQQPSCRPRRKSRQQLLAPARSVQSLTDYPVVTSRPGSWAGKCGSPLALSCSQHHHHLPAEMGEVVARKLPPGQGESSCLPAGSWQQPVHPRHAEPRHPNSTTHPRQTAQSGHGQPPS